MILGMMLVEVNLSAVKYASMAENKLLTKEMRIFEKLLFFAENSNINK